MSEGDGNAGTPRTAGMMLRSAREAQGLSLSDIGQRTRIPLRHLEAVEESNFQSLPSITYSMGFGRAYARAVGVDETEIARALRAELAVSYQRPEPLQDLEPFDTRRGPSTGVVAAAAAIAILILLAVGLWFGTSLFRNDEPVTSPQATVAGDLGMLPPATPTGAAAVSAPVAAAPAGTGGQVTLTATGPVWVRIFDASGTLVNKEMAAGERYDVPMTARDPQIRTGRPDLITVTLNGSNVPPLGTAERAITTGISADVIRARGNATPTPAPSSAASAQ
ncbi:helix-turn-helix domain-containing protein [Sphingomonas sp. CFBP 13720]|uniref:helix-turn-helix domain-containing protein n=1 Tax=Sphingomonas sp. CFBP 13720 TaxID=2775302 RepID=UPI00177EFFD9|nr:helix-turn-helix domain-containing protein [Sphingomonas sp. CFBP 13720]MBD8678199.1 helix-turn-helix domain-containing protein [Sphingomonas sp. CFBP 13720]